MSDEENKGTDIDPQLAGIIALLSQAGAKATPDNVVDVVRAVLGQLANERAISGQLRRSHRAYVAACLCGASA